MVGKTGHIFYVSNIAPLCPLPYSPTGNNGYKLIDSKVKVDGCQEKWLRYSRYAVILVTPTMLT